LQASFCHNPSQASPTAHNKSGQSKGKDQQEEEGHRAHLGFLRRRDTTADDRMRRHK
jgi:hypothetical protein